MKTTNTYVSGRPCPKGHTGPRYKSSQRCVECTALRKGTEQAFKHRERQRLYKKKLRMKAAQEAGNEPKETSRNRVIVRGHEPPPPEVIAEAVRAHRAPRNPFDDLLGNPLPGRSALDQKRADNRARFTVLKEAAE